MKKRFLLSLLMLPAMLQAQPIINSWIMNQNGKLASYWAVTGNPPAAPSFSFTNTTDSADVLKVCYTADSVWVRSHGMTDNMGKYQNPGNCVAQNYTFRFPRNPVAATVKKEAPMVGSIGLLLNGIPIFGLSNANSWTGSTNAGPQGGGQGVWNVEVYKAEGMVLDTAFGAHPQQQGAYHSHATPYRLYKYTPATQHAPLIGFAFDGYPVYGPYGYTNAMDPGSAITRMKSGYSLRNITTRTTLASGAAAPQVGPAVSTTYPIGTYSEDYEWLASNGGDLDQYNGRMCVTPEYPAGTYAYFVTIDANGQPAYPYIIGPEYYGEPDQANLNTNGPNPTPIQVPATATNCILPTDVDALGMLAGKLVLVPNPAISGKFRIPGNNHPFDEVMVYNMHGQVVQRQRISGSMDHVVQLPSEGMYFVRATETSTGKTAVQKIVWAAGY